MNSVKLPNGKLIAFCENITERKKAEEALEKEHQELDLIIDSSPIIIFYKDNEGKFLRVNNAFAEALNLSKEEFLGKTVFDLYSPKIAQSMTKDDSEVLESGHPKLDIIEQYESASGTRWVQTSKVPIFNEKGSIIGLVGFAQDITERKAAENKILQQNEFLNSALEALTHPFYVIDADDYTIQLANSATGFANSAENRTCYQVTHKQKKPCGAEHPCPLEIVKKTKKPAVTGHIHIDKNGNERIVEAHGYPIFGNDGTVVQMIEYSLDITERKKMENAIREGEEKLSTLLDTANVLVQSVDANGNFVYVNKEWVKILGYSDKDFKNLTLMDIIRSDHHKHCMDIFKQVINEKAVRDIETVFVSKDGQEIMVRGNAKPIFRDGTFISTVGFFLDITERKKAEDALKETLTKLETLNEKLGVVGKLTRHDARNKLSVIANNVYLAKGQLAGNHGALDYLDSIESAVEQMENLFDFARIYELLGAEELSYVDVEKSVDDAVILFSGLADEKLVNECDDLMVLADSLLRQVFYNLINDSLKHGEKVTQIRVYYKEGKDDLKLVYEDDGVGITEAEKENIFKEGYGKFTGYGLYLIKKTCEAYGWVIQETGVPDKGAQFTITIPKTSYMIKEP